MTPSQLDHLRAIDALCAKRIAFYGNGQRFPAIPDCLTRDAEAGWRATRAAIYQGMWLLEMDQQGRLSLQDQGTTHQMLLDILAAFPDV